MMNEQTFRQIREELCPRLVDFACRLVATRSLTCDEGAVAALVQQEMEALGYDEITLDSTGNVIGRVGSGEAALLLDGHMDTVTVNDADRWDRDPFAGVVEGGLLHGRGAADTKCPLAAAIYGAAMAKRMGLPQGKAIYVSASAMEEDYDGEAVRLLLQDSGLCPRGVVICEPTELKIATGHRGRSLIELHAAGKSCHGSTPELGENPVYKLRQVIGRVEALAQQLSAQTGDHGSLALTNIYCNTASNNSVPQDATVILDRRLALGETEEVIAAEMAELVRGTDITWCFSDIAGKTWTGRPFLFHSFLPAWKIDPEHGLVRALSEAYAAQTGGEAELFTMGCCTNGVSSAGVYGLPTVVFGPGSLDQAHSANEYCPVDELTAAAAIHARLCLQF